MSHAHFTGEGVPAHTETMREPAPRSCVSPYLDRFRVSPRAPRVVWPAYVDLLKKSLCLLIAKFKETGTVSNRRAAPRPRKLQDCHYHSIEHMFCVCVHVYVYVYMYMCMYIHVHVRVLCNPRV